MAKYYQRPDGLFETSRKINGKRVMFRGKTCREVDRKILEYHEDVTKGRPFPVVANEWYASKDGEISRSCWNVYGYAVKRLKATFTQRIGEIKPLDLTRYIRDFERKGYASGTVDIEITVIKQIFAYAVVDSGDIETSPASELKKSRGLPKKKRGALTEDQERAVEDFRGENWLFGVMLLYTGMRRGELLALDWQDIDRRARVIHVTKKLNWAYGYAPVLEGFTKNHKNHDVPLFDALARMLPTDRVGKIFTDEDGNYWTSGYLQRVWRTYRDAVGLDGVTPHCFRHSFATICFEAQIPAASAASFMGDTTEVVEKIYTDLRENKRIEDAEQVEAYLTARRTARGIG